MSDIQEEQKRLYKRAEENDLMQIAYKMTENTLLMKQAGDKAINKINDLILQKEIYKKYVNKINNYLEKLNKYQVGYWTEDENGGDIFIDIKSDIIDIIKELELTLNSTFYKED